jgi:hypothetical protein
LRERDVVSTSLFITGEREFCTYSSVKGKPVLLLTLLSLALPNTNPDDAVQKKQEIN